MTIPPTVFLSNRLDFLVSHLANLISKDLSINPKIILIPDLTLKPWLEVQLASRSANRGVGNFKILSWQEGVQYFSKQETNSPCYLELYLSIFDLLKKGQPLEVSSYVNGSIERLLCLSKELAKLFLTYSLYGWRLLESEALDWQISLFKKIFSEGKWSLPILNLELNREKYSVFSFACEEMPLPFWDFLFKLPRFNAFLFSPSFAFWTEHCSDREKKSLSRYLKKRGVSENKWDELEAYLEDCHPLLANFGKMGRETLKALELFDCDIVEDYSVPEGENLTLLQSIQKELLYDEISIDKNELSDSSIRIISTGASRLREIQILKDEILRSYQSGVSFKEMVILAPDIELYAPYIDLVFSDPELPIPYRLSEIDLLTKCPYWQGVKKLIDLAKSRWEVDEFLQLLENRSFKLKMELDLEKIEKIETWIRQACIRWGIDKIEKTKSVSTFLNRTIEETPRGTWEEGFDRILNGMVYLFPPEHQEVPSPTPILGVNLTDADEVEQFILLIDQLKIDLFPFAQSGERTLEEWALLLENLWKKYLIPTEEEDLGFQIANQILSSFRYASLSQEGVSVPFFALLEIFNRKSMGQIGGNLLHGVNISSLSEGSLFPCKSLFLIGLDEESYPRSNGFSSLDLLRGKPGSPLLATERDRYLFLRAICSAENEVTISYGSISPEEGKERGPSLVVQELMSYLNQNYKSSINVEERPSFNLHPRCFENGEGNRSNRFFQAARIFHGPKEPLQFLPPFNQVPPLSLPKGEVILPLQDLKNFFRHPWKFYLSKVLQIYIEENRSNEWEEFELDFIKRAQILRSGIHEPLQAVVERYERDGNFPVGHFGQIAKNEMIKTYNEWNENLQSFGSESDFSETVKLKDCPQGPFEFQPVICNFENLKVKIVGEIPFCSPKGPLHLGDDSIAPFFRNWPEYLSALCALNSDTIYSVRTGSKREILNPHHALQRSIELYYLGMQTPIPLINDWIDPLLRKGEAELAKKMEGNHGVIEDKVYEWMLTRIPPLSSEEIFSSWAPYLREMLGDLINLFSSKSKRGNL